MKYRASYHQERIWFIDTFERESLYDKGPVYHNIPLILQADKLLSENIIKKSLCYLINQNKILLISIAVEDNRFYQDVNDDIDDVYINIIDWYGKDSTEEEAVEQLITVNQNAFADGINGRLFRVTYLKLSDKRSYLMVTLHHSICDDVSRAILKNEFCHVYQQIKRGEEPSLIRNENEMDDILSEFFTVYEDEENLENIQTAGKTEYVDYAAWQKDLPEDVLESEVIYWRGKLGSRVQALEIPTDYQRAAVHIYEPATLEQEFPDQLYKQLKIFEEKSGITQEVFCIAAFKILLMKYAGQQEINIGISNRDRIESIQYTLGPISNLLLLSDTLDQEENLLKTAERVKVTYQGAKEHSLIPFDKLVVELNPEIDMSRTALFDVLFNYIADENMDFMEGFCEIDMNQGWGKYDYNLLIKEETNKNRIIMTYNSLYFEQCSIKRLIDNFISLCFWLLANPEEKIGKADCISEQEKQLLINEWGGCIANKFSDRCIHQVFEEQVHKFPERIAIQDGAFQLTYDQLDNQANQVANWLQSHGVITGDRVAIALDKNRECISIMLGILKAGGAYVPMDPSLPAERIKYMLNDCEAKYSIMKLPVVELFKGKKGFIGLEEFLAEISGEKEKFESVYIPENVAYIIYTSGTTGNPKGVLIEHKNVTELILGNKNLFSFDEKDVWTMFHAYNFDFSVWEMYGCLFYGGKLIIVPRELAMDTRQFYKLLTEQKVTILNQTPSAFYLLEKEAGSDEKKELSLRTVIFGGEALNTAKLANFRQLYPDVRLINMYGITETTVHVTFKELTEEIIAQGVNTIGTSLPTYQSFIVDENMNLVPVRAKGELVVGGSGVGRGYLNLPNLTGEKFIKNPFASGRLYRSGDLVRYKYNGELEYLGRMDKQVQIRGFRVETGEIETVLLRHNAIENAVVLPNDDGSGSVELVGYIIFSENMKCSYKMLSDFIKSYLPDYMIPARFIAVDHIPMTSNGKVEAEKLLQLKKGYIDAGDEFVPAQTAVEKELVEIWKETIDAENIGVHDNYFHLGGNSILVTKMMFLINKKFDMDIPYKYFFTKPTIQSLADYITNFEENSSIMTDSSLDLEQEMQFYVMVEGECALPVASAKNILLTGSTGFLGAYLLKNLLNQTNAVIYCLTRSSNDETGKAKILDNLQYYGLDLRNMEHRIIAVSGNLEEKNLGLDDVSFKRMSEIIDAIYHNAAVARYGFSYEQLKAANVLGTVEILRLAAQHKMKTVHYISTISVFDGTIKQNLMEDDIPDYGNSKNLSGYAQSKLVAEGVIRKARELGMPINIYRPGRICGDSVTGACQKYDFLWMMILACVEIGSVISSKVPSEMVPVDLIGEAIVQISLADHILNHNYHMNIDQNMSNEDIKNWLCDSGYDIKIDDYEAWYRKVSQNAENNNESACAALIPMLASGNDPMDKFTAKFDDSNTRQYIDTGNKFSIKSVEILFKNTITFFKNKNIFP